MAKNTNTPNAAPNPGVLQSNVGFVSMFLNLVTIIVAHVHQPPWITTNVQNAVLLLTFNEMLFRSNHHPKIFPPITGTIPLISDPSARERTENHMARYVKKTDSENTALPIQSNSNKNFLVKNSFVVATISLHGFWVMLKSTFFPSFLCTLSGLFSKNPKKGPAAWMAMNTKNTVYETCPAWSLSAFKPRLIAPPSICPNSLKDSQYPNALPRFQGSG